MVGSRAAHESIPEPFSMWVCCFHLMPVSVRLFGAFDVAVDGPDITSDASDVRELLADLESRFPVLDGRLLDVDSAAGIPPAVVVTVNKKDIRHLDGLDTELADGDVIRITKNAYPRR